MRDLLKILESIEFLTEESRGLLFRADGDRFVKGKMDKPERVLIFKSAEYYPSIPGEYGSYEEMLKAFNKIHQRLGTVELTNTPLKNHKAFALIRLIDEKTNKPFYSVRFFNTIKPKMAGTWKNDQLTKNTKEYQLQKETSLKHSYKLKPSDIFPKPAEYNNINMLLKAFEQSPSTKHFVPGFKMLYGKDPEFPVFENSEQYFSAIRDDLGEIIGPVALIQGLDMGTGAKAALEDLLGTKGSFAGSSISFPVSKTNNLIDSYIVTSTGVEIGLSSKGGKGAAASIKNLEDGIKYIKTNGSKAQKKYLSTYKDQLDLIEQISRLSAIDFPLEYAVDKKMISDDTATAIKLMIKTGGDVDRLNFKKSVAREIQKLHDMRKAKTDNPGYSAGYHALAALTAMVCKEINEDEEFTKACVALLNASPTIQLHMEVTKRADKSVAVTGFTSKYPPNFQGKIELSHDKNYTATNVSGKVTFLYNEKSSGEKQEPEQKIDVEKKISIPLAKAAKQIADKKTLTKRKERPKAKVGREKRK